MNISDVTKVEISFFNYITFTYEDSLFLWLFLAKGPLSTAEACDSL
jgi:hypothetical protein